MNEISRYHQWFFLRNTNGLELLSRDGDWLDFSWNWRAVLGLFLRLHFANHAFVAVRTYFYYYMGGSSGFRISSTVFGLSNEMPAYFFFFIPLLGIIPEVSTFTSTMPILSPQSCNCRWTQPQPSWPSYSVKTGRWWNLLVNFLCSMQPSANGVLHIAYPWIKAAPCWFLIGPSYSRLWGSWLEKSDPS